MEILKSLTDRATNGVVDVTWQQLRYVLDYHDNLTNLRDKLRDLHNSKARVGHQVEEATRGLLVVESDVLTWIERADEAILKVGRILAEDDKTCCAGLLPNFKNRYKLSKRAKLESPAISELADKGAKFDRVGYRVPLHHQVLPSDDYEAFGSRESTLNSVMDALRTRDADLIGVWGLGGVGKTTFAKEVGQRMKAEGVFQLVVTVEVHPKTDVKTIQERVAEWLGIKKEVESLDSAELRAALLHKRLLQERSVLVILDDVWDVIDPKNVGIPIGSDTNRCTVLVTARDESLVSQMADTGEKKQKLFELNVLRDDEAWKLFQKTVGLIPEDDHARHNVATQIVKRCGGLPILVLPVASALKNKELHAWEDALLRLQSGPDNPEDDMQAKAYIALELSCSHLNEEQKSLFLFCGLLEPYFIHSDYLLQCTISLGLLKDCPTIKAARSRVLTMLGKLKSSCLLLKGNDQKHFTMHDVVHNFARRRCKDHVFAPVAHSVVEEWPDRHVLEPLTRISLPHCQLPRLPTRLECPKLEVFLLYGRQQDQPLNTPDHDRFFEAVRELKVLDLSDVHLSSLPSSLQCLQNLQTLCVDRCNVEDVSVIGSLTKLKILSLTGAGIVHLPKEIGKLTCLQLLDVSSCRELKKISPGVLSCLTHLEELYMANSFTKWGLRDGNQRNADLAELKKLNKLTALEIGVPDGTSLPDDLFSNKLERFFIVIGDCWDWSRDKVLSATLKVKLDARIRVLKKVNVLLEKADDLHLDNSVGVKYVNLPELNMEGFGHCLRNLQLQNFHEVKCLVNSVQRGPCIAFPRLEALLITNAKHLEKICSDQLKEKSLANLKQIKVSCCDALTYVFPLSVARCLSKLEDIEVTYCGKMEGIFMVDEAAAKDEKVHLTQLRKLTLEHLPNLNNILSPKCHGGPSLVQEIRQDSFASGSQDVELNGMTFFIEKAVFPNIQELKVCSIKIHKIWDSGFPDSYSCIRNLVTLKIDGCKFIKDIFTVSTMNSRVKLQRLEIRNCRLLQEIIVPGEANKICLPKLDSLALKQLHSLQTVCTGDFIECPKLKELEIDDCPKLKTFITSSSHQPGGESLFDNKVLFPSLEEMTISNMDSLIMIWHEELHEDSFTKLKILCVHKARILSKLFSSNMLTKVPTLETLRVGCCSSLEMIFDLHDLIREEGKHSERITMLKDMEAHGLQNLKHVWHGDPHGIFSFQNLRLMRFQSCPSLESVVPASVAQQLSRLEELMLNNCSIEQIISKEDIYQQQDEEAIFVFPSLKRIELSIAPRLSSFYPGKHIVDWPALQHVRIIRCPRLEVFKSKFDDASQEEQLGQPLFSFEQVVTKLEKVSFSNREIKMISKLELPGVSSSKLKIVELYDFDGESTNLPINLLERFPNLETLEVSFSDFVELFTCRILDVEKETRVLSRIQHLHLQCLNALEHIWNPQSRLDHILNDLWCLKVWSCGSLVHLAPPSASLCNLTTLDVGGCKSLVSLFTFSTMKNLGQLAHMSVYRCDKLSELVAVSDEKIERGTQICLDKLQILKLRELGSITRFCSHESISLNFPLLVELVVEDCPQLESLSPGYVNAPKLKKVRTKDDSSRWNGDLNATIRHLYTDRTH